MRHEIVALIVLAILLNTALADDLQRQDQLVWDYAEFLEAFSAGNWARAERFVHPDTKIGFGGAAGREGLVDTFAHDDSCHGAMVRALELGCRKAGKGGDMRCLSPPHYTDPDVVYLGARASFKYSEESKLWMLEFLVCGGD